MSPTMSVNGDALQDFKVNDIVKAQSAKILEMAAVMQRAALADETETLADKALLSQLQTENQVS